MSLLDKFKNVSPSPRQQITVYDYERMENRALLIKQIKLKDKIKTFTLYACGVAAVIFTAYNIHEYNKSFDRCEALLAEVHQNLAILENELQILNQSVNGVDYE